MKGVCQFASLKTFDISRGICLDYMHGVLLGVTKQLMSLWLESKYKDQSWYCGDYLCLIDERLCSIQPPINITRTPRSIVTHRKYFKGKITNCNFCNLVARFDVNMQTIDKKKQPFLSYLPILMFLYQTYIVHYFHSN